MSIRIPLSAIGITREKKTVYPDVGKPFNFTADEIKELAALEKASKKTLIRKPVNEDPAGDTETGGKGADDETTDKYAGKTVPDLKAIAAERNIDLGEATKKDEILAVLRAADVAAEDEDL